jgi:branched-chain amino acid transport system permease protein
MLGSAVVVGIQNVVSLYTERWITVMGIIFVLTVLLARHGLIGRFGDLAGLIARARARPAPTVPETPDVGYETDVLQQRR